MVDVIFVGVFAGSITRNSACGLIGGQEADLAGGVAGDGEQKKGTAAGALDLDAKAFVDFFVEQVVGFGRVQRVAIEAVRALGGLVFDGVEERAIVGGPGGAGDALDALGKCVAGAQILDLQRVLAEAGGVERVGEKMIVVADVERAEAQERMAFGQSVQIEQAVLPGSLSASSLRQWIGYCLPSSVRVK